MYKERQKVIGKDFKYSLPVWIEEGERRLLVTSLPSL